MHKMQLGSGAKRKYLFESSQSPRVFACICRIIGKATNKKEW